MRPCGLVVLLVATATAAPAKQPKKPKRKQPAVTSTATTKSDSTWIAEPIENVTKTPGYRYSVMSRGDCLHELNARKIPYVRAKPTKGVVTPVRLTGRLHGVNIRTSDRTTIWEIADCRLVLAIDDFAAILAAHDVTEVRHYSMYRKIDPSWPDDKPGTRHNGGLAIDAARFTFKDGSVLDVDKDFNGAIGDKSCGDTQTPPHPATAEATKLRAILCEAVDRHLFTVVLTPNFNEPHHNHFHLEITAGWKKFYVK